MSATGRPPTTAPSASVPHSVPVFTANQGQLSQVRFGDCLVDSLNRQNLSTKAKSNVTESRHTSQVRLHVDYAEDSAGVKSLSRLVIARPGDAHAAPDSWVIPMAHAVTCPTSSKAQQVWMARRPFSASFDGSKFVTVCVYGRLLQEDRARTLFPKATNWRVGVLHDYRLIFDLVAVDQIRLGEAKGNYICGCSARPYPGGKVCVGLLDIPRTEWENMCDTFRHLKPVYVEVLMDLDAEEAPADEESAPKRHKPATTSVPIASTPREAKYTKHKAVIFAGTSHAWYRREVARTAQQYYEQVGQVYGKEIYQTECLPVPVYLADCVRAVEALGSQRKSLFMDNSVLGDAMTTIRTYIGRGRSVFSLPVDAVTPLPSKAPKQAKKELKVAVVVMLREKQTCGDMPANNCADESAKCRNQREHSHQGRMLITRRSVELRSFPGAWVFPGGRVDQGETLEECGARETFEETGVTVAVEDLRPLCIWESVFPVHYDIGPPTSHYLVLFLEATCEVFPPLEQFQFGPDEVDRACLIDPMRLLHHAGGGHQEPWRCAAEGWALKPQASAGSQRSSQGSTPADPYPGIAVAWKPEEVSIEPQNQPKAPQAVLEPLPLGLAEEFAGVYPNKHGKGIGRAHLFALTCLARTMTDQRAHL